MKVKETASFDAEFPEFYHWGSVDSIIASNTATQIRNWIEHDLKTVKRLQVPGLRKALVILAEFTEA